MAPRKKALSPLHSNNTIQISTDYDSLPSLAYSDISADECEVTDPNSSMATTQLEDVNEVLDDVIVKMNRVSDHLRGQGENEAANRVTREMISTFRYLFDVIASWDIQKCMMKLPAPSRLATNKDSSNGSGANSTQHDIPNHNTWASVASIAPTEANKIIKFRPVDGLKRTVVDEQISENRFQDRRVVWIRGWRETRPLSEVTESIGYGALYSMAYSQEDEAVCIIFQHAASAQRFLEDQAEYVGRTGRCQFGTDCAVLPGNPFPENEDLRRMQSPRSERRRLTFARSQLFGQGLTEERFRKDIEGVVGKSNVELVWLFNTGNASVVVSAVPLARAIREHFKGLGKNQKSPYGGVVVTFSHDPCERPMHLVTQMQNRCTSMGKYGSTVGNNHADDPGFIGSFSRHSSNASDRRLTGPSTKSLPDADGWQTVGRKR